MQLACAKDDHNLDGWTTAGVINSFHVVSVSATGLKILFSVFFIILYYVVQIVRQQCGSENSFWRYFQCKTLILFN